MIYVECSTFCFLAVFHTENILQKSNIINYPVLHEVLTVINDNKQRYEATLIHFMHWSFSIPLENIRKPLIF